MPKIITHKIKINTKGNSQVVDLTDKIYDKLVDTGLNDGIVTVFIPGSTAAISTVEYEPGLVKDIAQVLEKIIPKNIEYNHNLTWQDANGHSHLRAMILGPSLTVPFSGEKLDLGTWQQVVLIDFDNRSRTREIILKFIGI